MVIKVGINGFGRVGRVVFRTCLENPDIEVCAINDPSVEVDYICYLIKFDSTHGTLRSSVRHTENEIEVDDLSIKVFREKFPTGIPWHTAGAEYIVEASGLFTNLEKASGHLICDGVKRVIVTAPCVDVPMVILGVNDSKIKSEMKVISCGSSTLYCLAPIVKILEDSYGVEEGFITSIHAMTPSLKPLDGLCLKGKHWRDHRSITQNIIPAATGACKALGRIIPSVKDRLCGLAFRVPIANVSVLDLTIRLKKHTTINMIAKDIEKFNETTKNIIKTNCEEAVSSDFIGDNHSCILDIGSSMQLKPDSLKLICWYENEYSYACRVIDLILYSENQFHNSHPERKNCIQPEILKKKDMEQQTDIIGNLPKIKVKAESKVAEDTEAPACNAKSRQVRFKRSLPPPVLLNKCDNRKMMLSRIWNESPTVRQRPSAFFQACACMSPAQRNNLLIKSQERLEKTEVIPLGTRAQERLEKVKQEFSKMVSVTESLLKQSCSARINSNVVEKSESKNENIEPTPVNNNQQIPAPSKTKYTGNQESEKMVLNALSSDQPVAVLGNLQTLENSESSNKKILDRPFVVKKFAFNNLSSSTLNSKNTTGNTNNEELENAWRNIDKSDYSLFGSSGIGTGSDSVTRSFSSETVKEKKAEETEHERKNTMSKEEKIPIVSNAKNNFITKTFTNIFDEIANLQLVQNALKSYSMIHEKREEQSEGECKHDILEDANETTAEKRSLTQTKPSITFSEEITVMEVTKVDVNTNGDTEVGDEKPETINTKNEQKQHESTIDKQDGKDNIIIITDNDDTKSDTGVKVVSYESVSKCDLAESGSKASSEPYKQDIYDKLDSESENESVSGSDNAFDVGNKKSQIIKISDLTNSLEDLDRLDKICKIMEISDELSDKLFSTLNNAPDSNDIVFKKTWSFKDFCERVNLDEFCDKVFGK